MKKLIYILAIAAVFAACSAEKQLGRILSRHPELQRLDTLILRDTIVLPYDSSTITVTLDELIQMDSTINAAPDSSSSVVSTANSRPRVTTDTERSGAALTAKGDGKFNLTSYAKPDTIYHNDTTYIPVYTTEYREKPIIVHEMTKLQSYMNTIGWIAHVLALIYITVWIASKFIKK